uniref:glutathione peroxidase n=1 Tax=Neogobius melanostomus TaxID=47308 RepID=A0A8C6THZ0_9GOBI
MLLLIVVLCATQRCDSSTGGTIYEYQAKTLNGSCTVNLRSFRGRSVLFVNVATLVTLTKIIVFYYHPDLNALHEELKPFGLTILAFPSNQFGKQEPGKKHEILPALKYVRPGNGFVPNFLLFEKGIFGNVYGRLFWEPMKVNDIKWNFEKWHPSVEVSQVRAFLISYSPACPKWGSRLIVSKLS